MPKIVTTEKLRAFREAVGLIIQRDRTGITRVNVQKGEEGIARFPVKRFGSATVWPHGQGGNRDMWEGALSPVCHIGTV
jgi:hypothetical protein